MDVSVVIPCRNGAATLATQLRALEQQQAFGDWEIIVADNGSTDRTAEVVASFSSSVVPIRIIDASAIPGPNHARNQGVRSAHGRFVLMCDADDIVDVGWLPALWTALAGGSELVGGTVRRTRKGEPPGEPDVRLHDELGFLPWAHSGNCGFTRQLFDDVGGFDETFGRTETEFFWRAQLRGYDLHFVPEAVVTYAQREEPRYVFVQKFGFGRSHAQLYATFRSDGMPRSSTWRALRKWSRMPLKAARAIGSRKGRYHFMTSLGMACGRLSGSWTYRVWYP